jgi:putative transcriptional regulator
VARTRKKALEEVLASMTQASEPASAPRLAPRSEPITTGNSQPPDARAARLDALGIKELRARTELSQSKFAAVLGVELSTLRNWEQGRRVPTGPARALLRAIRNDPQNVIRALAPARVSVKCIRERDLPQSDTELDARSTE